MLGQIMIELSYAGPQEPRSGSEGASKGIRQLLANDSRGERI